MIIIIRIRIRIIHHLGIFLIYPHQSRVALAIA